MWTTPTVWFLPAVLKYSTRVTPVALLRLDDVAVQRDGVQVRQRRQHVHLRHDEDGVGVQVEHAQLTQLAQHLQPQEGELAVGQRSGV